MNELTPVEQSLHPLRILINAAINTAVNHYEEGRSNHMTWVQFRKEFNPQDAQMTHTLYKVYLRAWEALNR